MAKYISGPTRLTHLYSDKYKMNVILVGDDNRSTKKKCTSKKSTTFHRYMKLIFNHNLNQKFDYFLEVPFYDRDNVVQNNFLDKSYSFFNKDGCFSLDKNNQKKCKKEYPNVRFHSSDLRKLDSKDNYKNADIPKMIKLFFLLDKYLYNMPKRYNDDNYLLTGILILKIYELKHETNLKKYFDEFFETKYVKKQFNKIESKPLKNKIKKYLMNKMNAFTNNFDKVVNKAYELIDNLIKKKIIDIDLMNKLYKNKKNKMSSLTKYIEDLCIDEKIYNDYLSLNETRDLHEKIGILSLFYLDIYILSRLFKDTLMVSNAIIHTPEIHSITLQEILVKEFKFKILGEKINDWKNPQFRCIDLSYFDDKNVFFNLDNKPCSKKASSRKLNSKMSSSKKSKKTTKKKSSIRSPIRFETPMQLS